MTEPFVLLDDARPHGAADARLYRAPRETVVARHGKDVAPALERLQALSQAGLHLAGYLTYEAGLALEPRLAGRLAATGGPLLWFGAFDHCETLSPTEVPAWLASQTGPQPPAIGPLEPQIDIGGYEQAFAAIHGAIEAGDIYQANLTLPLSGPWSGDPLALYAALRPRAAAGYGAVIHDGARWHLSFSPELFFTLSGRQVEVRPMKGTRPRGRNAAQDAALRADLSASAKDRAENLMILDLMRNDLSRVSLPGSVRVERPFTIESYPTVHQMVSTVRAILPEDRSAIDLLRALFPCGSITGAPKIRAMELIDEVESAPRGLYCGAIGHVEPSGDAAFNVAIRTMRLDRDGRAVLGIGSAVVADSQALPEWRECLVKGGFVRESQVQVADEVGRMPMAPASFDLIETMRFTPEEGIALLELHLARIGASAAALGFGFDRHAVRNAIQALCFEAETASKLRLVIGRTGAYSLELSPLPAPLPEPAVVAVLRHPVDSGDWRLTHKTSDRGFYERGLEVARAHGAHEAILLRDDGLVTEGCFTNIFVERDGKLLTPPAQLGLLPGILRRSLLDDELAQEADLTLDDLSADFLIGNALRGLMPARLLD